MLAVRDPAEHMEVSDMSESICSVDGCERIVETREMCKSHYEHNRIRRKMSIRRWESGRPCAVDGCVESHKADGFCLNHYTANRRHGTPTPAPPHRKKVCSVEGCPSMGKYSSGMCGKHHERMMKHGSTDTPPSRAKGSVNRSGYLVMHLVGNRQVMAHRLVMQNHLSRDLLPHETVHHINGDRLDNRIENLELWSSRQPKGQRVPDKVAWAVELLELYAPTALSKEPYQLRL